MTKSGLERGLMIGCGSKVETQLSRVCQVFWEARAKSCEIMGIVVVGMKIWGTELGKDR